MLERSILVRPLSPSEQKVLLQSFQGYSYEAMAKESNYVKGYLKVVGAKLWQELSLALGQKVTKKNFSVVLSSYVEGEVESLGANTQQVPLTRHRSASIRLSQIDAPLPLGSPFYVNRPPLETWAYEELSKPGCLLRLKAPRRYGKSSLLLRIGERATQLGYRVVVLDLQEAEQETLTSLPSLLRWTCANFIQQLQLSVSLEQVWNPDLGSKISFKAFLQEQVLATVASPVVWVINEVDRVFEYPEVVRDFLSLLRICYEQAQRAAVWRRLRLVMAYSTEVYVPLQLNQSPFNVGMPLPLPPFNLSQATELAQRYGLTLLPQQLSQVTALVGGQPYLLNLTFFNLSVQDVSLTDLLQTAPTLTGIYRHHLQRCLNLVLEQPALLVALTQVLQGAVELDPVSAYRLASTGLVTLQGNQAQMSCQLYQAYFRHAIARLASVSA